MRNTGFTTPLIRFSQALRYAFQGTAHLARRPEGEFVLVDEIAEAEGLPKDFLAKIFQKLTHRGLLASRRGPGGGYALDRAPSAIRLEEIAGAVEEPGAPEPVCALRIQGCDERNPCALHHTLTEANRQLQEELHRKTLADLVGAERPERGKRRKKPRR